MALTQQSNVLIVVTDDRLREQARQLSGQYGWPMTAPEDPAEIMRETLRRSTRLVLLVLGSDIDYATVLIRMLRQHWRPVRVIAASDVWSQTTEAAARIAGASMCVSLAALEENAQDALEKLSPVETQLRTTRRQLPAAIDLGPPAS